MKSDSRVLRTVITCTGMLLFSMTIAQTYPAKPIRIIAPFPPGGGTDLFARAIGQKLSLAWGQQVVVDNRSGAARMIGSGLVARATPDGYTLLLTTLDTLAI